MVEAVAVVSAEVAVVTVVAEEAAAVVDMVETDMVTGE